MYYLISLVNYATGMAVLSATWHGEVIQHLSKEGYNMFKLL